MSVKRLPNGQWQARFRGPDKKQHSRCFGRKVDADRWETHEKSRMQRGEWVDPALGRVTVGEWAVTWLASKQGFKPTGYESYESAWRTLVEPRWGTVPLSQVTYADVMTWTAEVTARLSPSRTRLALLALKQILDLAVLDGRLARNVAKAVKGTAAETGRAAVPRRRRTCRAGRGVPPGGRAVRRSGPLRGPHRAAVGRNPGAAGQAARPASRAGGGGREHPGRLRRG